MPYEERTVGMLQEDYDAYSQLKKAQSKNFHSVHKQPIITINQDPAMKILDLCALPWLHIFLGVVNHAYKKLSHAVPEAKKWPISLHLHEENYHGSGFEGNECQTLLKRVDRLEEILKSHDKSNVGESFVKVFKSFHALNEAFSKTVISMSQLEELVIEFRNVWRASGMPLIPKVHMITDHLIHFVALKGSKNMYRYAEQAHETVHCEYDKTWVKYQVKNVSNPMYKDRFLRSVIDFNGSHAF